jgi:hypothetical protein
MPGNSSFKVYGCLLVVLLTGSQLLIASRAQTTASRAGDMEMLRREVNRHREWRLVNPEPALMDPRAAVMCAVRTRARRGPHSNKWVSVYVNEIGVDAMISQKAPKFPKGSIIVKEKLDARTSRVPELMTIMLKREEGYDPANGNWEYFVTDGAGTRLEKPARVESCYSCHRAYLQTDYVSRMYLPIDLRNNLK